MKQKKMIKNFSIKTIKPKNPVLAALRITSGNKGAGVHEKSTGAMRRAEKIQLAKEIIQLKNRVK